MLRALRLAVDDIQVEVVVLEGGIMGACRYSQVDAWVLT